MSDLAWYAHKRGPSPSCSRRTTVKQWGPSPFLRCRHDVPDPAWRIAHLFPNTKSVDPSCVKKLVERCLWDHSFEEAPADKAIDRPTPRDASRHTAGRHQTEFEPWIVPVHVQFRATTAGEPYSRAVDVHRSEWGRPHHQTRREGDSEDPQHSCGQQRESGPGTVYQVLR